MTRCLELLHMDLFGPSAIRSYGGNLYTLVIVDDYSRLFETPGLVESSSPELDLFSDIKEYSAEETTYIMTETMEQYLSKTRGNYRSGVVRPKINGKTHFELKGQYLKELRENTFSGSEHEDANEHIKKFLEIVDLFHIPEVTQDQVMLRVFPMSLTRAASRWLRNEPSGSIKKWETLKIKFLNKYCPPASTAKKMEEINNFKQEPDESLFRAWERFKELLMKCPQHYLTDMHEVILFYNGLDVPIRQILDSKGAIPTKTVVDAKITIKEMAEYSQKWHNGTSSKSQKQTLEESLTKFMAESAKRHEENSNIIKEIRASTDAAIRNQGASIKTLEIQIGQMSKVLQERGIRGFIIIDDEDVTRDVALGMPFIMEYVSCQMIMKKFAHEDKCERIMDK
ncbi:retrovirus-related pol polyprotein from transposon TNT 1-94 [Tanacetum coccineum]